MTIDVFCLRGTGEPFTPVPSGVISSVTRLLDPRFRPISVDYPASIGPVPHLLGASLDTSVRVGVTNSVAALRRTPNKAGLITYSLGSLVANQLLTEMCAGQHADLEISFVLNIANPGRREGESIGNVAAGFGIHGQRGLGPAHIPVLELANPHDMITAAAWDSPVRDLSPVISSFSLVEGARLGTVNLDKQLAERKSREKYWQFWNPRFWQRYAEAAEDVFWYCAPAPYGPHVSYASQLFPGTSMTYSWAAADRLNRRAW